MENCPQCNSERIPGENFCDECGHKYASEQTPPVEEEEVPAPEQPEVEKQQSQTVGPRISILNDAGEEVKSFYFEDSPKTIGRQDFEDVLTSLGKDPLQVSRKQCTMVKEGDDYYVEDGVTSVQDRPSGNHTTVNAQDITGGGRKKLSDNDKIVFATLVEAIFYAK